MKQADHPATVVAERPDDRGLDPVPERRIGDVETIKALSDPLRLRILEVMTAGHDETFTVKRLASTLEVSQTKLYHHVNLLVDRELIRPAGQRVVSGIIETSYRVAQLQISLDRSLLTSDEAGLRDVLTTVFDSARDDIERGLRSGAIRVDEDAESHLRLIVSKGVARLTAEQAVAFRERLVELIASFDRADTPDDTHPYGLVLGFYPVTEAPAREEAEA